MIKLLDDSDIDLQRLNEIERKAQVIKQKLEGKEARQKRILADYFLELLQAGTVAGLNEYVAENFEKSLTGDDKKTMKVFTDNLKKVALSDKTNPVEEGITEEKVSDSNEKSDTVGEDITKENVTTTDENHEGKSNRF